MNLKSITIFRHVIIHPEMADLIVFFSITACNQLF